MNVIVQQTGAVCEIADLFKLLPLLHQHKKIIIITKSQHIKLYEKCLYIDTVYLEEKIKSFTKDKQMAIIKKANAHYYISLSENNFIANLMFDCDIPLRINASNSYYYCHTFNRSIIAKKINKNKAIAAAIGIKETPKTHQALRKKNRQFTIFLAPNTEHYLIYQQLEAMLQNKHQIIWLGQHSHNTLLNTKILRQNSETYEVIEQLAQSHILVSSKDSMVELGELIQINTININRYVTCINDYLDVINNVINKIKKWKSDFIANQ